MKDTIARHANAPAAGLLPHERRRANRIRLRAPVRIIYQGVLNESSEEGICTDLSEAGLGFETLASLYVGEIVEVEFRDQEATPFRFQVRLLYKMGNCYGAYFVSPGS
jgi:PilZ domain